MSHLFYALGVLWVVAFCLCMAVMAVVGAWESWNVRRDRRSAWREHLAWSQVNELEEMWRR